MAVKPAIHGRDHCPGGADPIPCLGTPWARLVWGSGTAPSGTWTKAKFTEAQTDEAADPNGYFGFTDLGDRFMLNINARGLYILDLVVGWTNSFAEAADIDANAGGGTLSYNQQYALTHSKYHSGATSASFQQIQHFCALILKDSSATTSFDPQVRQLSGVDRGFDAFSFRAVRIGDMAAAADWTVLTT